MKKRRRKKER